MRTTASDFRRAATGGVLALLIGSAALPDLAAAAPASPAAERGPGVAAEALRSAVTDEASRRFYEQTGWRAVWSGAARRELRAALDRRGAHGLHQVSFLDEPAASGMGPEAEAALTRAALQYARALAEGQVDPTGLHQIYTLPRPRVELAAGLADALARGGVAAWLDSLPPQDETYAALSRAYRSAQETAAAGGARPRLPADGLIHVGDRDPRVAAIARQLTDEGYLDPAPALDQGGATAAASGGAEALAYTRRMAEAVKRLQVDFGLARDGVIGPDTLEVLNLRPGDRARALAVGLERRRWLARNPPATRIDVNLAAARLRYLRNGRLVDARKVIVGKPGRETPLLMSPIFRLVANPTWTVPKSIENSEMAHVGAGYLRRHNMVRRNGYIVQSPGPDNALGVVKFDMHNDHAIYLHDTAARSLFARSQRHLSHGCVRVADAPGFARMLAEAEGVAAAWQAAQASGEPEFVDLPDPIPVRLLYENAFVDDGGAVVVRTDPYGWNGPVAKALGFDRGADRRARAEDVDIGP